MKKTFSKQTVKKPLFPKLSKKSMLEILEENWCQKIIFFAILPLVFVIAVLTRIALLCSEAREITPAKNYSPNHLEKISNTYNAFEISVIYFISLFFDYGRYVRRCWRLADIIRERTQNGEKNLFRKIKSIIRLIHVAFFVFIQNVIASIVKAVTSVSKFICDILKKPYQIKGATIAIVLVVFILTAVLVGVFVNINTELETKKEISLNSQTEFELYVVQPYDGLDEIALQFKPDYMGIRDNPFDNSKYNYEYYLLQSNPHIAEYGLHPGDIIKCPKFDNVHDE